MQMNRRGLLWITSAAMVLTATVSSIASQERAIDNSEHDRATIVGSWMETVTLSGGFSFKLLYSYDDSGVLIASAQGSVTTGPFPFPQVATTLHGKWTHRDAGTSSVTLIQIGSDPYDGHLLYLVKVRETVTLNRSGDAYRSVGRAEYFDPDGNLLFGFDFTSEARRITVEPLN